MKLFLLSSALLATFVAATDCSNTLCQDFAVHAGTTVTFADGGFPSEMIGDVGVFPGTDITGIMYVNFSAGEVATAEKSAAFASSSADAYSLAMSLDTPYPIPAELGGEGFGPGTYSNDAALNIAAGTVVTLDGMDYLGEENAVFIFKAGTTLTTGASTSFALTNGAKAENVFFILGSAATLGANSVLEGSITAGTSVTVGSGAQVNGCIIAKAAVTYSGWSSSGVTYGANSALTFDASGSVLEQCIADSPADTPASSPTAANGDPHCKYQRFRLILLACRSFILLSCRIFDLQSGPGRTSTLNTTDSATWFLPKIQSLLRVSAWTFISELSLFVSGVTSSKPLSALGMTFSKLKVLRILKISITGSTWNTKENSRRLVVSQ
jgi:hypothetical protein